MLHFPAAARQSSVLRTSRIGSVATQPAIQWVLAVQPPEEHEADHHLVLRLRTYEATHVPLQGFMVSTDTTLLLCLPSTNMSTRSIQIYLFTSSTVFLTCVFKLLTFQFSYQFKECHLKC